MRRAWTMVGPLAVGLLLSPVPLAAQTHPDTVPSPFETVRVETEESSVAVRVWGREYRFSKGPVPDSVKSQGHELLAGPARIRLDGSAIEWSPTTVVASTPASVHLSSRGSRGPLRIQGDVVIEFDGMIRVDLEVSGDGTVSSLRYELPIREEYALFFNHHAPYDYGLLNIDKGGSIKAAGVTPRTIRRYEFSPSFALSDREVGIEWWSETNAHWNGPRVAQPFVLDPQEQTVVLAVEPLGSRHAVSPGEPWRDRFAVFPMPMRPPPPDWRSVRFVSQGMSTPRFDPRAGARLFWIAFGTSFHPRWHGLPESLEDPFQKRLRERLAERGIAFIPYGKLTVAPSLHPRTLAKFDDWSATGSWFKVGSASQEKIFELNAIPYERGQPYTYAVCMGRADYLDWILEENLAALEAEDLDGLYFDHGAITRMCSRSPVLEGRTGREVWEYFNVRDFYKRLYTAMKQKNPDALLVIHSVGQPRAISGFVDFHWMGEHLNYEFSGGRNSREVAAAPHLYRPDYLSLPDGYLTALTRPHVGGVWTILPQIKQAGPERATAYHRGMQAWALLNDVPIVIANTDMKEAEAIARALDRFGNLADAELHPWWSSGERVRVPAPLRATLYRTGARGLLVIANLADQDSGGAVTLDRAALGLADASKWRNLEATGRAQPIGEDSAFPVHVPKRDFRLYVVE